MSAFRQAMLSVPPERLEQFSLELKQKISSKKHKKSNSRKHSKNKKSDNPYKKDKSNSDNGEKSKIVMTRKQKNSKERKSRKKKRKQSPELENLTDDSDVEENGLNLSVKLYPLSHYVKDRQELAGILFRVVKGAKLSAMLPDNLKEMPLNELKQKCFSHLEVMSSKRINHILVGEAMHSSSGTDSEEDQSQNNEAIPKGTDLKTSKNHQKNDESNNLQTNFVDSTTSSGCEVLSLLAAGSERENISVKQIKTSPILYLNQKSKTVPVSIASSPISSSESLDKNLENSSEIPSDVEEEIEMVEVVEDEEYANMVDKMLEETLAPSDDEESSQETRINKNVDCDMQKLENEQSPADETSLSQLELLELQLRARAIKSLMKATQTTKDSESK